jgi:hypothetical protein
MLCARAKIGSPCRERDPTPDAPKALSDSVAVYRAQVVGWPSEIQENWGVGLVEIAARPDQRVDSLPARRPGPARPIRSCAGRYWSKAIASARSARSCGSCVIFAHESAKRSGFV